MYTILINEYFDENMCSSDVIGCFDTYEEAEQELFRRGFEKHEYDCEMFNETITSYILQTESEYRDFEAEIKKLTKV